MILAPPSASLIRIAREACLVGLALGCIGSAPAAFARSIEPVVVATSAGPIEGDAAAGVARFRDIPFAAAPVGALRWRAPQPAAPWPGIRSAHTFSPACPQPDLPGRTHFSDQSEDCLYLNVTAPVAGLRHGRAPVMVWIHGGGFQTGSGTAPQYDGGVLAAQGVIVVTLNYRLGALGWFAHPALRRDPEESDVNFGLLDQIAALRWVRDNIGRFGGDPRRITLFGESSGGEAIALLMAAPPAKGLFRAAIIQSGFGRVAPQSLAAATEAAQALAAQCGLTEATPEQLRAAPIACLLAASFRPRPILDGRFVAASTEASFSKGLVVPVPLLIGSNDDDASLLGPLADRPDAVLKTLPAGSRQTLSTFYPELNRAESPSTAALLTDVLFTEPARLLARGEASLGMPVFRYQFAYAPDPLTHVGAAHAAEIPYVFGTIKSTPSDPRADERHQVSERMVAYWSNFAKAGDPNGPGLPRWNPQGAANSQTLVITADATPSIQGWRDPALDAAAAFAGGLNALASGGR